MLFKSFIVSLIMYCRPVRYPAMYQRDKKDIRKISKDATSLGLELGYDLDSIVNNQTKSSIMQIYMDDEHFMQEFLERCHSGRLRHTTCKYRTAWGKDCFLRHMCIYINKMFSNIFLHARLPHFYFLSSRVRVPAIYFSQLLQLVIAIQSINQSTYFMGKSESYMSYVNIHSCCIQKCLRYAQIHTQYGQIVTFHMLTFINVICKFMCDMRYLICCICSDLYATCPDPFMIYPFCYLACLKAFL